MKTSRRGLLLGLMGSAAAGALAACGATPTPQVIKEVVTQVVEQTVVVEKEVTAAAPVQTGEKQIIEMWNWETEPRWRQVQLLSGLDTMFPNVEFKWTSLPYNDIQQKALTAMAANLSEGLPSIVRTNPNYLRPFVNAGGLVETTDMVQKYKDDVMPFLWEDSLVDGKTYSLHDDTGVMLLGYRWDLFEKAGLPTEPDEVAALWQSYDDLIQVGKTLDQALGAKLMVMGPDAGVWGSLIMQGSTGYFDANGDVIFDSEYHARVAEIAVNLFESGVMETEIEGWSPQEWQAYKEDKLALSWYPNWQDFVFIDTIPETKGKWRACKLPAVETGGKRATTADGCLLVIPSAKPVEEQQVALQVAEYMKYTVQATVAHMKTFSGAFVSYIPGLEAMAEEKSPFLDNQYVYKLYLDTAREEDVLPLHRSVTSFYNDAGAAAGNAMFSILKDKAPIEDTLKGAADSIRQLQQDKGTK